MSSSFFQLAWLARSLNPNISMGDLREMLPTYPSSIPDEIASRPGRQLAAQGVVSHHPVVMIPGVMTSGLEVWRMPYAHALHACMHRAA